MEPEIRDIDLKMEANSLYREETFTDRRVGTLRRLVPVKSDGSLDNARQPLYQGQTQLLTPVGTLPLSRRSYASRHK
jgi:hypothetical protein